MATIEIKRVYEPARKADGFRILVDRLWPRGFTTRSLQAHSWMKEMAPSPCLRIWYKHHPDQWEVFSKSFLIELKINFKAPALESLLSHHKKITLVYAWPDEEHNHAVVLQHFLYSMQGQLQKTKHGCS